MRTSQLSSGNEVLGRISASRDEVDRVPYKLIPYTYFVVAFSARKLILGVKFFYFDPQSKVRIVAGWYMKNYFMWLRCSSRKLALVTSFCFLHARAFNAMRHAISIKMPISSSDLARTERIVNCGMKFLHASAQFGRWVDLSPPVVISVCLQPKLKNAASP